jgi:tRNA G18 (ribose-2'-O)-methylase SpoU
MVAHTRLTSADDARLDDYRRLTDPALRRQGLIVAESGEVVRQLIRARQHRLRSVLATEAALHGLREALASLATPPEILVADVAVLREVTGFAFHRGCLALAERGPEPSLEALLAAVAPGPALVLALDDVSNPDNVGALFRNAAAFGVGAVLLTPGSGDPLYRKTIRVSMGQTLCLPWARVGTWQETANRLGRRGFTLVALTPDGEDLERLVAAAPPLIALVVGNEGSGLSAAARAACDRSVGIRMDPGADSLNVATATAVALYRLARPRLAPPH